MTPSATPMLIDSTGQLEASETVRFGVDGRAYEIDLSAQSADELRSMVGHYIRVARKVPSAPSRARQQSRPPTHTHREQPGRIRSQATQRGLLASPRRRIPQHVGDEHETTALPVNGSGVVSPLAAAGGSAGPGDRDGTGVTRGTARAARDKAASTANMAAAEGDVRGGEHGLSDREKQELRAISDAAKPLRNIVAARLLTKGLADRDTAGNWWLTDAGRRKLTSA